MGDYSKRLMRGTFHGENLRCLRLKVLLPYKFSFSTSLTLIRTTCQSSSTMQPQNIFQMSNLTYNGMLVICSISFYNK